MPTEQSTTELATGVGLGTAMVVLLALSITIICVILCMRLRARNNTINTATNTAYHSRTDQDLSVSQTQNHPLPLSPRPTSGLSSYATIAEPDGTIHTSDDLSSPEAVTENVAYRVLQNGTDDLSNVNVRENIAYCYSVGSKEEGFDYAIVSDTYGTAIRKVF